MHIPGGVGLWDVCFFLMDAVRDANADVTYLENLTLTQHALWWTLIYFFYENYGWPSGSYARVDDIAWLCRCNTQLVTATDAKSGAWECAALPITAGC